MATQTNLDGDPVTILAYRLNAIGQHLDPCDGGEWDAMGDGERQFFRECVDYLLADRATLLRALSDRKARLRSSRRANHHLVDGRV